MRLRVLVIGSQGLLGRILCKQLAEDYDLYGLDIKAADYPQHYQADILNPDELSAALQAVKPDYLLHFAGVKRALNDFDDNLRNMIGTRNVYQAAVSAGVKRVIYASSNQVVHGYEQDCPEGFSVPIDAAPRPTSYYACGKLFGEAVARYHFERDGLESICLRIGSLLESDLPPDEGRVTRSWLSHRDLVQITRRSIQSGTAFGVYYAVSGNTGRFHDISNAAAEIAYVPLDNAAVMGLWARIGKRFHNRLQRYTGGRFAGAARRTGGRVTLEDVLPKRCDLFRVTVQPGLVIDVFWKALQSGKGPALSVFVDDEEFAKFDCFGPGKGHYHLALSVPATVRQQRIRFSEDRVAEQISRTIFEVENNLGYYLERAANPVGRTLVLQQDRLLEVLPQLETRMRRYLQEVPELLDME